MTLTVTPGYDCTGDHLANTPQNAQLAGYVTGTAGIAWTAEQFAAHPNAIRIDQTPSSTSWDATSDGDDYESGAVALDELAGRAKLRLAAFRDAKRPGQRVPFVYMSASNITPVVNALIHGGVTSGVGLWVAHWGLTEADAEVDVEAASGPFPIIGMQYNDPSPFFDVDVWSAQWLRNVSGVHRDLYTHTTSGHESLGQIANSRHMGIHDWVDEQFLLDPGAADTLFWRSIPPAGNIWHSKAP